MTFGSLVPSILIHFINELKVNWN